MEPFSCLQDLGTIKKKRPPPSKLAPFPKLLHFFHPGHPRHGQPGYQAIPPGGYPAAQYPAGAPGGYPPQQAGYPPPGYPAGPAPPPANPYGVAGPGPYPGGAAPPPAAYPAGNPAGQFPIILTDILLQKSYGTLL